MTTAASNRKEEPEIEHVEPVVEVRFEAPGNRLAVVEHLGFREAVAEQCDGALLSGVFPRRQEAHVVGFPMHHVAQIPADRPGIGAIGSEAHRPGR
jgi:hypothetical protein